jgi:hypothetical protein
MSWYFIAPSIALLAVDVAIRFASTASTSIIVDDLCIEVPANPATGRGGVVRLSYKVSKYDLNLDKVSWKRTAHGPMRHAMGQYAWINIPEIDPIAWHPFTISSSTFDEYTTHHIKSMGFGAKKGDQWTNKLYEIANMKDNTFDHSDSMEMRLLNKKTIRCRVEGPYGSVLEVERYTHILLVGGGIGITPLHSVFRETYFNVLNYAAYPNLKRIGLIWVTKTVPETVIFSHTVRIGDSFRLKDYNHMISYQIV